MLHPKGTSRDASSNGSLTSSTAPKQRRQEAVIFCICHGAGGELECQPHGTVSLDRANINKLMCHDRLESTRPIERPIYILAGNVGVMAWHTVEEERPLERGRELVERANWKGINAAERAINMIMRSREATHPSIETPPMCCPNLLRRHYRRRNPFRGRQRFGIWGRDNQGYISLMGR